MASSAEGFNSPSSERKKTPADLWIAAAREDAESAYKIAYNSIPPNIEDKLWAYLKLYEDLEAIRRTLPEVAAQLKVRYVNYKRFYELSSPKNMISLVDNALRDQEGDAVKYHNGVWRFFDTYGTNPIYRNPLNPEQLMSVGEYLEYRLDEIKDESGIGLMLVDVGVTSGLRELTAKTPDQLTGSGKLNLALPTPDRIPLDGLGIIEWMSLVTQPVATESQTDDKSVKYQLPQLSGAWLLANRLSNRNGQLSHHVPFANYDFIVKRNHLSLRAPTESIEGNVVRTAVIRN
jgi:hypothetical protein